MVRTNSYQKPITAYYIQNQLGPLMKDIKESCFVAGYNPPDEEVMGLLIAKFFKWDGLAIAESAGHALEDANFHELNERLQLLIDTEFKSGQND